MIYKYLSFKDKIRYLLNRILGINFHYLTKIELIKFLKHNNIQFKYKKGEFVINWNNSELILRDFSSDIEVFKQIFINKEYEFALTLFENKYASKPHTFIDLGSNIGLTSIYFKNHFADLKILALEPEQENFKLLQKNTASFNSIKSLNKGIWNDRTELKISSEYRDRRSWAFQLNTDKGNQLVKTLKLIDLFELIDQKTVDILKIDIEGAEKEVLLEDVDINQALEKVRLICVEVHDEIVSRIEITNKLKSLGFDIYSKNETLYGVK